MHEYSIKYRVYWSWSQTFFPILLFLLYVYLSTVIFHQLDFNYHIVSVDVNECDSAPCQFGATCHDDINGYHCQCADGYTGVHCETGE